MPSRVRRELSRWRIPTSGRQRSQSHHLPPAALTETVPLPLRRHTSHHLVDLRGVRAIVVGMLVVVGGVVYPVHFQRKLTWGPSWFMFIRQSYR